MLTRSLYLALALLLAGCGSIDPQVYRDEKPSLDLQRYFNGTLEGHGLFQDRSGQVQRRFVVTIKASWAGDVGTLDEDFLWSDGKREKRIWTLRRAPGDPTGARWIGTADGVVGEALGVVSGNALHWAYTFDLQTEDGARYRVAFDDWMFLIDERVLLNRAVMRWYGLRAGEVLISFRKL